MSRDRPEWFVDRDVEQTVQRARAADVPEERVVETLAEHAFDGLRDERITNIVERVPDDRRTTDGGIAGLSQSPSATAEPREIPPRRFSVDDVEYLSDAEFARVLGLALEQFGGESIRTADESPLDLYWSRDETTVGIRAATSTSNTVDARSVETLTNGTATSPDRISPDSVVLTTDDDVPAATVETATEAGIAVIDRGQLETVFERAALPAAAVGTVLEDGATHDGPLAELVDLDSVPEPRRTIEAGATRTAAEIDVERGSIDPISSEGSDGDPDQPTDTSTGPTTPNDGTSPPPGETGVLYADPDEDGDYDAFDEFTEEI